MSARTGMTDDEINALARQIADEAAWVDIESLCMYGYSDAGTFDSSAVADETGSFVDRAVRYLDARGLLERPDPANPNIVRRKTE